MRVHDLDGKVAIVTGANHGIGAATAIELARHGADIVATYLRYAMLDDELGQAPPYAALRAQDCSAVVQAVSEVGSRCVAIEEDLGDLASPARIFNAAKEIGPVSILVNNASSWRKDSFSSAPTDQLGRANQPVTAESVDAQFLVDARGAALMIAEFASHYRRHRAGWGRIVSVTSGGRNGFPGEVSYGAAKAALESFTMSASRELFGDGVTANIVHPPPTDTGWITESIQRALAGSGDYNRIAQPEEVGAVVAWLCTPAARLVTGNIVRLR